MRRFLLSFSALLLLSACEPSVDDYVQNARKREDKLRECGEMGVMAAKDDAYCQMAMEAQSIAMKKAAKDLIDTMTLQSASPDDAESEKE